MSDPLNGIGFGSATTSKLGSWWEDPWPPEESDCPSADEWLDLAWEKLADPQRIQDLRDHLPSCFRCSKRFADLQWAVEPFLAVRGSDGDSLSFADAYLLHERHTSIQPAAWAPAPNAVDSAQSTPVRLLVPGAGLFVPGAVLAQRRAEADEFGSSCISLCFPRPDDDRLVAAWRECREWVVLILLLGEKDRYLRSFQLELDFAGPSTLRSPTKPILFDPDEVRIVRLNPEMKRRSPPTGT